MVEERLRGRRVLVTGATGFLGTHLVRALVEIGAEVHAVRRDPRRSTRLPCEGIRWHEADLLDAQRLRRAVDEAAPDVVFHLAAYGTVFDEKEVDRTFRVNVVGTWNLWQAVRGSRCRLVYAGSCGEYGEARGQVREDHACRPTWFYPATKNAGSVLLSTLARTQNQEIVILRPFGPYGPADDPRRVLPHSILTLLRGQELRVTAGEQLRDFAYVEDHIRAFLLAAVAPLRTPGAVYNVGSGRVVSLRDAVLEVARQVGPHAVRLVRFGALPYRETEVWEMCCDIGAARRDLGFSPRVSLEEGIARTVGWFREHGGVRAGSDSGVGLLEGS